MTTTIEYLEAKVLAAKAALNTKVLDALNEFGVSRGLSYQMDDHYNLYETDTYHDVVNGFVSLRMEQDLADGCVCIYITPQIRKREDDVVLRMDYYLRVLYNAYNTYLFELAQYHEINRVEDTNHPLVVIELPEEQISSHSNL